MEQLVSYMKYHSVPDHLKSDVISFYSNYLSINSSKFDDSILEGLPLALKRQLEFYTNLKLIHSVPMFQSSSMKCKEALSKSLETVVAAPDEDIIRFGEIGHEMYFVGHGSVEVISEQGNTIAHLESGAFFGEMALLKEMKRNAGVKAITYCTLYKLNKSDFIQILEQYNDLAEHIKKISKERS